jgi:hypothetical protein
MDKVHKPSDSLCRTASSELFRFYQLYMKLVTVREKQ